MNQLSDHRPRVPGSSSVREAVRRGESEGDVEKDGVNKTRAARGVCSEDVKGVIVIYLSDGGGRRGSLRPTPVPQVCDSQHCRSAYTRNKHQRE